MNLFANIDGASLGNPGDAGYGVVVRSEDGTVIKSVGRFIGKATNNVAEYHGLLGCLSLIRAFPVQSLTVYSDSLLLVNQINGSYKVKQPHLQELFRTIKETLQQRSFRFRIVHIPREQNKEADRLASRAAETRSEIQQ